MYENLPEVVRPEEYDGLNCARSGDLLIRSTYPSKDHVVLESSPSHYIMPRRDEVVALILANAGGLLDALIEHGSDVLRERLGMTVPYESDTQSEWAKSGIASIGKIEGSVATAELRKAIEEQYGAPQKPASRELIQRELEKACAAYGLSVTHHLNGDRCCTFKIGDYKWKYSVSDGYTYAELTDLCGRIARDASELERSYEQKRSGDHYEFLGAPQ